MPLFSKYQVQLLLLLCLIGCSKKDSTDHTQNQTSPPQNVEIVSGNNKIIYSSSAPVTDTIMVKITPVKAADVFGYTYRFQPGVSTDNVVMSSSTQADGTVNVTAYWKHSTAVNVQQLTFYIYVNCPAVQNSTTLCSPVDSAKITNYFRQPWVSVYNGFNAGYVELHDLYFTDTNNGLAVGEQTGTVRTADGGKSWTKTAPAQSVDEAYKLTFANQDTGLVVIYNNYAYLTFDGGKTFPQSAWSVPPIIGNQASAGYAMLNKNVIYTVGANGPIVKTIDGGATWSTYTGLTLTGVLTDISCIGKDTCYACGTSGTVVRTTDAGKLWQVQPSSIASGLNHLYFITSDFGFACGQGKVIRTTNGGQTWTSINAAVANNIIAVRFFSGTHGFVVTDAGEVAESKNGGLTWTLKNRADNGVFGLTKVVIKDETVAYGLQDYAIFKYNLTQQ